MSAIDIIRQELEQAEERVRVLKDGLRELTPHEGPPVIDGPTFAAETTDFSWLVGGLIANDTISMLVADPGLGKTTLLAQMALCLSTGNHFLAHRIPESVNVLTIAAEGSRAAFRARWTKALAPLSLQPPRRWYIQPADIGSDNWMIGSSGLEEMIRTAQPKLVILDTIGYFWRGDENSSEEWKTKVMIPLRELVARYRTAFMLVHHRPKQTDPRVARDARGTSAMLADVDHFLMLEPGAQDTDRRLLIKKNKYGPSPLEENLVFDHQRAWFDWK